VADVIAVADASSCARVALLRATHQFDASRTLRSSKLDQSHAQKDETIRLRESPSSNHNRSTGTFGCLRAEE
jgi:hypothetical protein